MLDLKKFKFVKNMNSIAPRLKWLLFSQMQDYKIRSNYINLICPDTEKEASSYDKNIEEMVRATILKEFSESIKDNASYELLVDAVINKIKKQQLDKWENLENDSII